MDPTGKSPGSGLPLDKDDLCSILLFHECLVSKSFIAETEIFIKGNVVIDFFFIFWLIARFRSFIFVGHLSPQTLAL